MRFSLCLIMACLAISGCSKIESWQHPEVVVCENFLKDKLKSPASYNRVSFNKLDEKLTKVEWSLLKRVEFSNLTADEPSKAMVAFRKALEKDFSQKVDDYVTYGGIRTVLIEYDADNSFGTALRGLESCDFLMRSFSGEFDRDPELSGDIEELRRASWGLGKLKDENEGAEPSCCLNDMQDAYSELQSAPIKRSAEKIK